MKIPEALIEKWKALRSHGDGKEIAEANGFTEAQISKAFINKECSDEIFEAIAAFFKEKEERVKSFM